MKRFIGLTLFLVCSVAQSNCSCPPIVRLYKEIGCTAVDGDGECPSSFDCRKPDEYEEDKCYYNGKPFADEEKIPNAETFSTCTVDCVCDNFVSPALFTCSAIDCDIDFSAPKPDCVRIYTNDSCCAHEEMCEKEKIEALGTCELDGKTYRFGERMYPKSHLCHKCICSAEFDKNTITSNENCVELGCGLELRSMAKLREGCIPIYFKDPLPDAKPSDCCPLDWRCPDEQENFVDVVGAEEENNSDSTKVCSFGNVTMPIGSTLASKNDNVECKCTTPPMPHCLMKQLTFDVAEVSTTTANGMLEDTTIAEMAKPSETSEEPVPDSATEKESATTTMLEEFLA